MSPLRYRMIEDMQVRNLAPDTQRAYLQQITQFACHFGKSPEILYQRREFMTPGIPESLKV
jgi:integrase/recombinase XerD